MRVICLCLVVECYEGSGWIEGDFSVLTAHHNTPREDNALLNT